VSNRTASSPVDLLQIRVAADEGGGLGGQVVVTAVEGGQRREAVGEVGVDQLEQPLGTAQVLEAVGAEVAQVGSFREPVGGQGGRRRRQQHLAAMADGHDPCGAVDCRAEVVAGAGRGLAGVQPHPHPQRPGRSPRLGRQVLLRGETGACCGRCRGKDGHDPVAGRLDHLPTRGGHGGLQDLVVALQGGLHGLREPLPQPGAALDVGEQEDHRSRRRLRLHRTRPSRSPAAANAPQSLSPRQAIG
jgi:hypothetical protein